MKELMYSPEFAPTNKIVYNDMNKNDKLIKYLKVAAMPLDILKSLETQCARAKELGAKKIFPSLHVMLLKNAFFLENKSHHKFHSSSKYFFGI